MVATTPRLNPLVLSDVELEFTLPNGDTVEFAEHVTSVTFTPSASTITLKTMSPTGSFSNVSKPTWVAALAFAQDWDTDESLSNFLFDHTGETIPCVFRPLAGGKGWEADLIITPGAIGGAVDAYAVATVNLGVNGRPSRLAAPAAVPAGV